MRRTLAAAALSLLIAASVQAAVLLHVDFEPPAYSPGHVNGQDGWSATAGLPHQVVNTIAHGGSQSLNTVRAVKDFSGPFPRNSPNFYLEGYCYTRPMPGGFSSHFAAANGLGESFSISLRGDGLVTFTSGGGAEGTTQIMLGAVAINKWLRFRIEKVDPLDVKLSLFGDGVDVSWVGGMNSAGDPSFIYVGCNAPAALPDDAPFWDDVHAATDAPTPAKRPSWGAVKKKYR